jgi:hypothetical protein
MNAILYWDKNFKGETSTVSPNDQPCEGPDDYVSLGLGKCGFMSCSDQITDRCNSFGGQANSYKIDDGIVYRAYSKKMYNGETIDLTGSSKYMPDGWSNKIFSYKVLKDCNNSKWMWDPDCNNEVDKKLNWKNDNIINPCKDTPQNKCFQNKFVLAQSANLNKDTNLLKWCKTHQTECEVSLKNYCKTPENISNEFCQEWCKKMPGECDTVMEDFCKIPANKTNILCSCNNPVNLELKSKFDKMNPICFNKDCLISGYKNKDFKVTCEKCLDTINFKEPSTDTLIKNIQESCNLVPKTDFEIFWEKYNFIIIITIVVLILLSIISCLFRR